MQMAKKVMILIQEPPLTAPAQRMVISKLIRLRGARTGSGRARLMSTEGRSLDNPKRGVRAGCSPRPANHRKVESRTVNTAHEDSSELSSP